MNQSSHDNRPALRIAFVQARWHADIVDSCRTAFVDELGRLTGGSAAVEVFDVPGAFDIPLQVRTLARTGRYAAVVACAFVVDGGIYRHDFVADAVVSGLMQAQMEADLPVLSAVLTPHNYQDTEAHRQFFREHFKIKGHEAAEACLDILALRKSLVAAA
jgi:6,7-dimethyl-8-ribityllumazine synthase